MDYLRQSYANFVATCALCYFITTPGCSLDNNNIWRCSGNWNITRPLYKPKVTYTRERLYYYRRQCKQKLKPDTVRTLKDLNLFHFRAKRSGYSRPKAIPVMIRDRYPNQSVCHVKMRSAKPVIIPIAKAEPESHPVNCSRPQQPNQSPTFPPSLYILNPTSIAKPHRLQHLSADLLCFNTDLCVLAETWLKKQHLDSQFAIDGFSLFRNDRIKRKSGGVAIYVKNSYKAEVVNFDNFLTNKFLETLWVKFNSRSDVYYVCAIYNPPRPLYAVDDLLFYLSACTEHIFTTIKDPIILLAGDWNTYPDHLLTNLGFINCTGNMPTHQGNPLDRLYTSCWLYNHVNAVTSTCKTKHKAVVASSNPLLCNDFNKTRSVTSLRPRSPAQNANLLMDLQHGFITPPQTMTGVFTDVMDLDSSFSTFLTQLSDLFDKHFPQKQVTITSRDPPYMTPYLKFLLRKKQKLIKSSKFEAAEALSSQISNNITKMAQSILTFPENDNRPIDSKTLWGKINNVTGKSKTELMHAGNLAASDLNLHYSKISSDQSYTALDAKHTCQKDPNNFVFVTVFQIFNALDKLKASAAGIDGLPSWFLKLCAPAIAEPLTVFYNSFIYLGHYPENWKTAVINPIPKISNPIQPADYRPISLTPILSRILEKFIVRQCFYPLFSLPSNCALFRNQFAFKPTGSTTSALINLLHIVTHMLAIHPFVHIISLDFSKAFDTVRHTTVLKTLSMLGLPDNFYNWLLNFLNGRKHVTRFASTFSDPLSINASVIQGSAVGPSCFIATMSNLTTLNAPNELSEYADDCYLIVTSEYSNTISVELSHIKNWAYSCNLKLNDSKCKEIVITRSHFVDKSTIPKPIAGLDRVSSLNVLGVTFNQNLSFGEHVDALLSRGHQRLYAIKILKHHGLNDRLLFNVSSALFTSIFTYASSAWWGFLSASDLQKLEGIFTKAKKWGLLDPSHPTLRSLFVKADSKLFDQIKSNKTHCLYHLLPPLKNPTRSLRPRRHNFVLPTQHTNLQDKTFIYRELYFNMY